MSTLRPYSLLSFHFRNFHLNPTNPLSPCINVFSFALSRTYTSTTQSNSENHILLRYLIDSLKCPKHRALAITNRISYVKSLEKPQAAVHFFRTQGFSDTQIRSLLNSRPQILILDSEKVIKPKLMYFQELGIPRPHLAVFISKNPMLLTCSLDNKLKPCIELIKKVLELIQPDTSKCNENDMFHILSRYAWVIGKDSRLLSSIKYLESCGIVGSQLIMILKNEPRLVYMSESKVKSLISRVTELGFVVGSRMFVYGVFTCYSNSAETLSRKYGVLQSFGFSKCECTKMLLKSPSLFKSSEVRLRHGIEFFLNTCMLDKSSIVACPNILVFSMEKRVVPRYRVYMILKSRGLVDKLPSISSLLTCSETKFTEKYILRFQDDAKELLLAYEGRLSES
ncbi:hypothetical protein F511_42895 [Dorcoceras hygrometricum]|uniref:Mitochondrial transcription termination factor family protein n=1 Tax=Dorcoceras hygrometricum TaxID=472368 RepID=A0A2Z7A1Q2_9LAMI|nr:hypothetical protein F511_42895 [Dorcoceras hygrometricum]